MYSVTELAHRYNTLPFRRFVYGPGIIHIGEYKWTARTADFAGWLLCDGRQLERSKFPELFEIIGTSFGTPSNSNMFALPDMRGRVMGAVGAGTGLTNRIMGTSTGTERHQLSVGELPSHSHTVVDPGHVHTQTTTNDDFNNSGTNPPGFTRDSAGEMTWNNINAATTGITLGNTGSNASHNNMHAAHVVFGQRLHLCQPHAYGNSIHIRNILLVFLRR
jgi:microcystin-dependent protein